MKRGGLVKSFRLDENQMTEATMTQVKGSKKLTAFRCLDKVMREGVVNF